MQKLMTRVALLRRGVRLFENDVNRMLDDGWTMKSVSVEKKGLRIICLAVMERTTSVTGGPVPTV